MNNLWKIDLSVNREIRSQYIAMGKLELANSVDHLESIHEGKTIALLTLAELLNLKETFPNETLISIFGEEVKANDVNEDTRFGFVAAGRIVK